MSKLTAPKKPLLQRLRAHVDEPMWADHCEMPKSLLREAIGKLEELEQARKLIETCRGALATELAAWDTEPPFLHVKAAHDECEEWLSGETKG